MQRFTIGHAYGSVIIYRENRDITQIRHALAFLRRTSTRGFFKTIQSINCIGVIPGRGGYNEMLVKQGLWVVQSSVLDCPHQYLASLLLHEAHHVAQFKAGKTYMGRRAEWNAYLVQRRYLKKIEYLNAVEWLDKQYNSKWWESMNQDVVSKNNSTKYLNTLERLCECPENESKAILKRAFRN